MTQTLQELINQREAINLQIISITNNRVQLSETIAVLKNINEQVLIARNLNVELTRLHLQQLLDSLRTEETP